MLTEVAKFIKTPADWYRALAYLKLSGANLFSHENRLPRDCSVITKNNVQTVCICNPQALAADGFRPSTLYSFYDQQEQLVKTLFPGKAMSYAVIRDGFPRVSETGAYENADGMSSDRSALPGGSELTQSLLDRGQSTIGKSFVVQHNGIKEKGVGCPFDGIHPKPVRTLLDCDGPAGSQCPNKWAVREGAEGQITGFQTSNKAEVLTPADLDLTLQNAWDNSDAIFIEVYEDVLWTAENTTRGVLPKSAKTIGGWTDDFHRRRVDPLFPAFTGAASAFPSTFSRTFSKTTTDAGPQTLNFIHGMKCGGGLGEWGSIVIDAQPPVIKSSGIVSASGFGQFASVAPGSWIEIYGSNLSATSRSWADADFLGVNAPTSLDSTAVKIGGQSAFIDSVSPSQVNAQVPSNVPLGSQTVTVTTSVGTSPPLPVNVNVIQPGLNAPPSFIIGGKQYVAALFADGFTYVLPAGAIPGVASRRAKVGETIVLYGVGCGPVTPALPAGQVVLLANSLIDPLQVSFAGLVSGSIGLYQFNVIVPNVVPNDAVPLTFTVGAVAGTQTLFIAIQN